MLTGPGSVVLGLPLAAWRDFGLLADGLLCAILQSSNLSGEFLGMAGLAWAWSHEWIDGHLCLWCSTVPIGVIAAIILSIAWRTTFPKFWHGIRAMGKTAWILGGGAGLLSGVSVIGYQVRLGTDTWGVVGLLSALWGLASAWITALMVSRSAPSYHDVAALASKVMVMPLTTVVTSVCVISWTSCWYA